MPRLALVGALVAIGGASGLSLPLLRIAVSTGHGPFGLMVWQNLLMLAVLLPLARAAGQRLPPLRGRASACSSRGSSSARPARRSSGPRSP